MYNRISNTQFNDIVYKYTYYFVVGKILAYVGNVFAYIRVSVLL